MNKSANKTLITMKVNNNVQTSVAFTSPKNKEMLLKEREKGAEDSCDIDLVGPKHLSMTPIFENMICGKTKKGKQRSPNFKRKNNCVFPMITTKPG